MIGRAVPSVAISAPGHRIDSAWVVPDPSRYSTYGLTHGGTLETSSVSRSRSMMWDAIMLLVGAIVVRDGPTPNRGIRSGRATPA